MKVTEKGLFDRITLYNPIVYRIHGYCCRSLLLILFTVYTITVDCYTVPLLSPYRPNIISNMDIDCHDWINNNVKRQLTQELKKLMEEITYVF